MSIIDALIIVVSQLFCRLNPWCLLRLWPNSSSQGLLSKTFSVWLRDTSDTMCHCSSQWTLADVCFHKMLDVEYIIIWVDLGFRKKATKWCGKLHIELLFLADSHPPAFRNTREARLLATLRTFREGGTRTPKELSWPRTYRQYLNKAIKLPKKVRSFCFLVF